MMMTHRDVGLENMVGNLMSAEYWVGRQIKA
jgi:hypothetical protein